MWNYCVFEDAIVEGMVSKVDKSALELLCSFLNRERLTPDKVKINVTVYTSGILQRRQFHTFWFKD
ncbi:MAG: hypothetical protein UU96_C0005G0024 [Parcubacteria group bacterium GW2011_GWC2_42_13]|nr:MAG: hypothetical protein UU96_C0005G0024 [Parcubacteria group bacterium GW2011_GWC2_42_13]